MLPSDCVWYKDVRVLTRRPSEFFPRRDQSPEERINSIVRLLAYCTLAVYMYKRRPKYFAFGAASIALVSLAYRGTVRRGRGGGGGGGVGGRGGGGGTGGGGGGEGVERRVVATGGIRASHSQRAPQQCTLSTPENPFANMLLSDLADNPGRAPACKYDDHKDLITENFNSGLVRNSYDIYEKENNQRQFITMPVTTSTPDTVAFAQFCYGNSGRKTCKEDPSKCTGAFP